LAKIYATSESCEESNGMQGLQTSTGANDILAWGQEECLAWYTPMAYASQRPAAWAPGVFNDAACQWDNELVWTSGTNGATIDVVRLNGEDGSIDSVVNLGNSVSPGFYGIYGAASDADGNFWGSQLGGGKLVYINAEDLTFQTWQTPAGGYGMTVDPDGKVWTCSSQVGKFDPETEMWQQANTSGSGGCMADDQGLLWQAGSGGMRGVDRETLQVVKTIVLPEYVHGVSVDLTTRSTSVSRTPTPTAT
jgi:sugar lactone lactonase YvrE